MTSLYYILSLVPYGYRILCILPTEVSIGDTVYEAFVLGIQQVLFSYVNF